MSPFEWFKWACDVDAGSPAAQAVLFGIVRHVDADGVCWAGQDTIARNASTTDRTVRNNIPLLVARGLVQIVKRPGRSDVYQLTPEGASASQEGCSDVQEGASAPDAPRKELPVGRKELPVTPEGASDEVSIEESKEGSTEESTPGAREQLALVPEEPEPDPAPAWMASLRKKRRAGNPPKPPKSITDRQLYDVCAAALGPIRSSSRDIGQDAVNAVMALWSAMSGDAGHWLPCNEARRRLILLGVAAKQCPHLIFAREIRAEGWDRGTDRSSLPAAVFRINPPDGSSGASWSDRLAVAEQWAAAVGFDTEAGSGGQTSGTSEGLTAWRDLTSRPHVSPPCKSFAQFVVVLRQNDLSQWQDGGRIRLADSMPEHHRRYRALLGAGALGRNWETDHADPVKRAAIRDDFARRYTELSARGAA